MDCQKLIVYGIILLVGIYILKDVCGVKIPMVEGMENIMANTIGQPSNSPSNANVNVAANSNTMINSESELLGNNSGGPGNAALFNDPSSPSNNQAVPSMQAPPSAPGSLSDGVGQPSQLTAAEPGANSFNMPIQGIQTAPSNCYPQNTLTPQDLLPEGQASQIQQFNEGVPEVGEGILRGVNYLDSGFHVGVNTVGQSLRNANLNLRAEPPNPRSQVSPWMMSTIDIDLARRPLNDGECNMMPGQTP
jgi:hypothetical protein